MLVLSRKEEETILFPGTGITVKVLSLEGGRVKVGIDAPREQRCIRGELEERETIPLHGNEGSEPPRAA